MRLREINMGALFKFGLFPINGINNSLFVPGRTTKSGKTFKLYFDHFIVYLLNLNESTMLVLKPHYLKVAFYEYFNCNGKNLKSDTKLIDDLTCYIDLKTEFGMEAVGVVVVGIEDARVYYVPVLWMFQLD
jgi:hypothetical protein